MALQLAHGISSPGIDDWMGFPIVSHGRVLYMQQDTPRSTWALRIESFQKAGYSFNSDLLKIGDRETFAYYPLDMLQPDHCTYLAALVRSLMPVTAVFIDTLRKAHTGNENDSTVMSNVMTNLIKAVHPAALILVSHDRKPNPEMEKDIMTDHRGSTSVVGEMDAILRLTKTRMYYAGRNIEQDSVKLLKKDVDDTLIWDYDRGEFQDALISVIDNQNLPSLRAKARELAKVIGKSDSACMSMLVRHRDKTANRLAQQGKSIPEGDLQDKLLQAAWSKTLPAQET